ncbi:MAG TPA: aldehyde dehydrogenase family protein, partial [Anaerolineales bacterium]|nr:aldehyde dehydrogenase family protein [Anaerolineales bacterium]
RDFAQRNYVRPIVLELGGKNPAIVSRNANLEDATTGIYRSAFGLQGQKCSAASRILVEAPVYDEFIAKLKAKVDALLIGDPTERNTYLGPVINQASYNDFKNFTEEINQAGGKFLTGGHVKTGDMYDNGYFCEPTLVTDLPFDHRLWQYEMFLPISTVGKVENLDQAMKIANNVNYGLTAGFYGSDKETRWFFDNIEAGVTYANRPQGATTGAWPGFQPFGGWKGSGASGKNGGGYYYVQLYMHEQIQTLVKPAKNSMPKKKAVSKKKVVATKKKTRR